MTETMSIGTNGRSGSRTFGGSVSSITAVTDIVDGYRDVSTGTRANQSHGAQTDSPVRSSPRFEAFVMTGDKMLNLNPKISPNYAKVHRNQLPPKMDVSGSPIRPAGFDFSGDIEHKPYRRQRGVSGSSVRTLDSEASSSAQTRENSLRRKTSDIGSSTELPPIATANGTQNRVDEPALPSDSTVLLSAPSIGTLNDKSETMAPRTVTIATTSVPSNGASPKPPIAPAFNGNVPTTAKTADSSASVRQLAQDLFDLNEFDPSEVSAFLIRGDDFSERLSVAFLELFNFSGLRIDAALRLFLDHVSLTGESSERAQILKRFADRYDECNPTLFDGGDAIHALACALLLLNTDLHSKAASKKMSTCEFINNLAHTGFDYDRGLLKTLYSKIKNTPFESRQPPPSAGHRERQQSNASSSAAPSIAAMGVGPRRVASVVLQRRLVGDEVDYYRGWVMVKENYGRDGKRTPFGRRGWKMYFATVRGLVLYLHANEKGFESGRFEVFRNCIRLHHAFAELPREYRKKPHVFRLTTAKLGEFLIQSSSPEDVLKWIHCVNFVSAALSTPALPEAVASREDDPAYGPFRMAALPSAMSTYSLREQLVRHNEKRDEINQRLERLRSNAPPIKARGDIVQDYFYRERYLERELLRYRTYAELLVDKLARSSTRGSRPQINGIRASADRLPHSASVPSPSA